MKLYPAFVVACAWAITAVHASDDTGVVSDWNTVLSAAQKLSGQTLSGRSRAEPIVRAALVGALTGIAETTAPVRPAESPPADANLEVAASQAAYTVLDRLYPAQHALFEQQLARSLGKVTADLRVVDSGRAWGDHVAQIVLADFQMDVLLNRSSFSPPAILSTGPASVGTDAATISGGNYNLTVLAGSPDQVGTADGLGSAARFRDALGLVVDDAGIAYLADTGNHTIRKITPDGVVSTLAGLAGVSGSSDGIGAAARFNFPSGLALDRAGNLYVADYFNYTIRKISPDGSVSTLAGLPNARGNADGLGSNARFTFPTFLAVDSAGNVFVTDAGRIRKVTPAGEVFTLALEIGYALQIAVDREGNLFVVADGDELTPLSLRKVQRDGTVVILASLWRGFDDVPQGIAVDAVGNLLTMNWQGILTMYTPSGAKLYPGVSGSFLQSVVALAIDRAGSLYALVSYGDDEFTGTTGCMIAFGKFNPNGPSRPIITMQALAGFDPSQPFGADPVVSDGDTVVFSVTEGTGTGSPAPTYQWFRIQYPTVINGASTATLTLRSVHERDSAGYYVVATNESASVKSNVIYFSVKAPVVSVTPPAPSPSSPSPSNSSGGGDLGPGFVGALLLLFAVRRCAFLMKHPRPQ